MPLQSSFIPSLPIWHPCRVNQVLLSVFFSPPTSCSFSEFNFSNADFTSSIDKEARVLFCRTTICQVVMATPHTVFLHPLLNIWFHTLCTKADSIVQVFLFLSVFRTSQAVDLVVFSLLKQTHNCEIYSGCLKGYLRKLWSCWREVTWVTLATDISVSNTMQRAVDTVLLFIIYCTVCSAQNSPVCPNSCSGHGKCIDGNRIRQILVLGWITDL